MQRIRGSIAIFGIVTVLSGLTPMVQPVMAKPILVVQKTFQEFIRSGLNKYKDGDYKGAIADYDQAILLNPNIPELYVLRGNAFYDQGDMKTAIKDYDKALMINPKYDVAYVERGNARDDLGDRQGAIADYNRAISINPDLPDAYSNRAITYIRMKNKKAAIADLQTAADLFQKKGNIMGYNRTMQILERLEKTEEDKRNEGSDR